MNTDSQLACCRVCAAATCRQSERLPPGRLFSVQERCRAVHTAASHITPTALRLVPSLHDMQVASEDTVLYTQLRYTEYYNLLHQCEHPWHARAALAKHIRCQHLSLFWLVGAVASKSVAAFP
jgi:hypothetical protein